MSLYKKITDCISLTKPKITLMSLIVAFGSMALADGFVLNKMQILSLLGICCLVSGASSLNMFIERESDLLMPRTCNRPLPTRRLSPIYGIVIGTILSVLALIILWISTNYCTIILAVIAFISYLFIYTPMKKKSSMAIVFGAIAGAMPALMGYTSILGKIDLLSVSIFLILFIWQLPHSIAISIYREEEYLNAGYKPITAEYSLFAVKIFTCLSSIVLMAVSFMPYFLAVCSKYYVVAAFMLGGYFTYKSSWVCGQNNIKLWARQLFVASLFYQFFLFTSFALDLMINAWLINSL